MIEITQNKVLLVALVSASIAIIVFSNSENEETTQPTPPSSVVKPEAFIEGATFKLYDTKGYATTLDSHTAFFYPESDKVDIQAPHIKVNNSNGSVIELNAKQGKLSPETESLSLSGSVTIKQISPQDNAWSISGEEFFLDNAKGFISTDQAVTIQKGHSTLSAIGLKASLEDKNVELLSKVRGQYALD